MTSTQQLEKSVNHIAEELNNIASSEDSYEKMYKYLCKCLDVTYTVTSDKKLKDVKYLVTFGGPNIYINTKSDMVEGYWGGDEYAAFISDEAIELIFDISDEIYSLF